LVDGGGGGGGGGGGNNIGARDGEGGVLLLYGLSSAELLSVFVD